MTLAAQSNNKPLRHVFNVRAASAQVIVLDLLVDCEQAVSSYFYSPLGVDAVFAYAPCNVLKKFFIFEHKQVRVEDVGVLCAQLFFGSRLDCEQLHSGKPHGCAKPSHLTLYILLIKACAIDLTRAVEDAQHAPYDNAFGDTSPAPSCLLSFDSSTPCQRSHSPKPSANRPHTALMASLSSTPSAVASSSVPREAASISTLKIDFASADAVPSVRSSLSALL